MELRAWPGEALPMHRTADGDRKKALQKVALAPAGSQGSAEAARRDGGGPGPQAPGPREDLTVWEVKSHPSHQCSWARLPVAEGQDQRGAHKPDREDTALDLGEKAISH
jgi:hypothetical protein